MDPNPDADDGAIFVARLSPRRSFTPVAARKLLVAAFAASSVFSLPFYLVGAWPIVGFLGLDVLMLWLAFRASFRAARAYEDYRLTYLDFEFARVSPHGARREWRFNPAWVTLEHSRSERAAERLALRSSGRRLEIATFLGPDEKAQFAGDLGRALGEARRGRRFGESAPWPG